MHVVTGRHAGLRPGGRGRWPRRLTGPVLGIAVLVVLVARLGSEPFAAAVAGIDTPAIGAALVLGAGTTACCAWRWTVVANALGVRLGFTAAFTACYRSQLVNVLTPGGVAGDVLRGVDRGRGGDTALGLRSVLWERLLGQGVQVGGALLALLVLPSPVPRGVVWAGAAVVVTTAGVVATRRRGGRSSHPRALAREARTVLGGRVLRQAVPASVLAVTSLVLLFMVASRAVGGAADLAVVPLALVVLVGAAVPANLAGWGPREGVAAWAFGAAGLGTGTGLSASLAFGVLVLVASLPGAVAVLVHALRPDAVRPDGAHTRELGARRA